MASNRRIFFKRLSLGAGGLVLLSHGPSVAWAVEGRRLSRSAPEAEGVSTAGILAFLDALSRSKHELHSFMLVRHGCVVAEGWWSPYGPEFNHTMDSMSKSFTSTAVGFAVAEGKLKVDDRVVSFFPKELPEQVSENLAALRVKDLLTMSVGNEKEPTGAVAKEENWVKTFLAQPVTHPPGSVFMYNSAATYMCSAIVQQVTGEKLIDYLKPRLFEPLGIEGATWETCPRGINTGGWGLNIQTEGLAKFGQLYLQKGAWRGHQVLPAAWVEEATTFKIQQPLPAKSGRPNERNDWLQGYCYQFWRCQHRAFRGDGAFGQFTIVMPGQDAVVAITSESKDMQGQLDLVWEHLLPAMKETPMPADQQAQAQLQRTLSSLALTMPKGQAASPTAARISGKTFKLEANELGLQSTSLVFQNDGCIFTMHDDQGKHSVTCGLEKWRRGETAMPGTPPRLVAGGAPKPGTKSKLAASGVWKDENTFEMMWRYYETPHHDIVTCHFDRDKLEVSFLSSITKMSPTPKDKRPVLHGLMTA
ncbi:MAG: serine hydrolase [Verrucomicrobia bacterium]|nr:serine hydrolase [Verrucomicrobiota bacterium]